MPCILWNRMGCSRLRARGGSGSVYGPRGGGQARAAFGAPRRPALGIQGGHPVITRRRAMAKNKAAPGPPPVPAETLAGLQAACRAGDQTALLAWADALEEA